MATAEITPKHIAEQWIFDYFYHECLSDFKQGKEMDDRSRKILQMLMDHSIDVEDKSNQIKANVLIVISYLLQLKELQLDAFPWSKESQILKSKTMVTELLDLLKRLVMSLHFFENSDEFLSSTVFAQCRSCLFYTNTFMLQVLDQLRRNPGEIFEAFEVESSMKKTLRRIEKTMDSDNMEEKEVFHTCKGLLNDQRDAWKVLHQPNDICNLLHKSVIKINEHFDSRPQILQYAEAHLRIQSKLEEVGSEDLLSFGHSSVKSLKELASNKSDHSDSDSGVRQTKETEKWRQSSIDDPSSDSSSSGSRSNSSSSTSRSRSDCVSETAARGTHNRDKRPGVSNMAKLALKLKALDQAERSRPVVQKLARKPESHARVNLGKWTPEEEEKFVVSVLKFGPGNWRDIKEDIQAERSTMQLKDKWRNIPKSRIHSIAKQHGLPIPTM